MNQPNLNNHQLVELLKSGDRLAFQRIYSCFWKECFLIAYRKLNSKTLAEEATQNVFVSLWDRRTQVEINNLEAYLYSSIRYQVLNIIKEKISSKKHLAHLKMGPSAYNNSEDGLFFHELKEALDKAVGSLPTKTGRVYHMSRNESLSGKEIAKELGLSEKSVEYHMSCLLYTSPSPRD